MSYLIHIWIKMELALRNINTPRRSRSTSSVGSDRTQSTTSSGFSARRLLRAVEIVLPEDQERYRDLRQKRFNQSLERAFSNRQVGVICFSADAPIGDDGLGTSLFNAYSMFSFRTLSNKTVLYGAADPLGDALADPNEKTIVITLARGHSTISIRWDDGITSEISLSSIWVYGCVETMDALLKVSQQAFGPWHKFVVKCVNCIIDSRLRLPQFD